MENQYLQAMAKYELAGLGDYQIWGAVREIAELEGLEVPSKEATYKIVDAYNKQKGIL